MSENKHTPEPWIYQEDSDAYTHIIRQKADQRMIIAYGPQSSKGNVEHNIRRIVACVNACAGISTEALEAEGSAVMGWNRTARKLIDVAKQRDELLAALVKAADAFWKLDNADIHAQEAEAAIASVKGGA